MWSSKAFFERHNNPGVERDTAIIREVLSGNTPSWMFDLVEVKIGDDVIEVMPDYLAIGTDEDFVRCPMGPEAAQVIAYYYRMSAPIPALVGEIWAQANTKLSPLPQAYYKDDSEQLGSRFVEHNKLIEDQLKECPKPFGLIAGHKKDVVSWFIWNEENKEWQHKPSSRGPGHVWIYGWHKLNGIVEQPLTDIHGNYFVDYSQCIRLVRDPSGKYSGPFYIDEKHIKGFE